MTPFFDAHTHVQFAAYDEDREAVLKRALEGGVWIVNVGTQQDTSVKAIELTKKYPVGVYASVGLHPIHTEASYHDTKELGASAEAKGFTSRGEIFDFAHYESLARNEKVVAIGECGLDYYRLNEETKEKQKSVFLEQVRLAATVKKPLMIHCREAFADLIHLLEAHYKELPDPRGVIHFFSGNKEDARRLLDLGFAFTFGGVVTFATEYNEVLEYLPLEAILSETDAPYITPVPHRGKRNEPLYVQEVVAKLAAIKGISVSEMQEVIFKNATRVFGIK